jgi:sugar lactone lactonase YvrE
VVVLRRDGLGALSSTTLFGSGAYFVQQYTNTHMVSAYGLALSPDGAHLYATGYSSDALVVLARDPVSGTLTTKQVLTTSVTTGLDGVFRVVVSADGRFVYTAGGNNGTGGVCVFARNTVDGTLTLKTCYIDNTDRALNGASDLALSPDGKRLFVSSRFEDGVNAFDRNADTGLLIFADVLTGTTTASGVPLQTTRGVVVSPDGGFVYATGNGDDAVVSIPIANPAPLAVSLAPAGAINTPEAVFTLTVNGEDFLPSSRVRLNGIDLPSVYVNETRMLARLTSISMGGVGTKDITVWSPPPVGGSSNAIPFVVLNAGEAVPPSVLSVDVLGAVAGSGPINIAVNGMNFVSGAQVLWNGSPRQTTLVSSTLLNATLTAEDMAWPGSSALSVQNPGVLAANAPEATAPSSPVPFRVVAPAQNPPPGIASLSPVSATQLYPAARLEVRVNGSGFVLGAQAQFNGEDRPTQFIDANTLTMTLSAGDLVMPGVVNVVVTNPAPGGGDSNSAGFVVEGADLNQVFLAYLPLVRR